MIKNLARHFHAILIFLCVIFLASCALLSGSAHTDTQPRVYQPISIEGFYDAIKHWNDRTGEAGAAHYELHQIEEIAENILLYQRNNGGWPTNKHPLRVIPEQEKAAALAEKNLLDASFDNRNIYPQIEYLMRVWRQTGNPRYRDAAVRGLRYTLDKQYPNGGWAHSPDRTDLPYYAHITFADEIMPGVLTFLREVAHGGYPFDDLDHALRQEAAGAVAKGDRLILQLQVRVNNQPAGWAGQYHEQTLEPMVGRSFELPGILAWESVPVVDYLMAIDDPSPDIIAAVQGAVAWFDTVKLTGFRIERIAAEHQRFDFHAADYDVVVIEDKTAKPIWARFYDLHTNQPFLANRDGKRVYRLEDVLHERRTGYSWYGYWPEKLLNVDYHRWKEKYRL